MFSSYYSDLPNPLLPFTTPSGPITGVGWGGLGPTPDALVLGGLHPTERYFRGPRTLLPTPPTRATAHFNVNHLRWHVSLILAITDEKNRRSYPDRRTHRQTTLISGVAPLHPNYRAIARHRFTTLASLSPPPLHTVTPSWYPLGSTMYRRTCRTLARRKSSARSPTLDVLHDVPARPT